MKNRLSKLRFSHTLAASALFIASCAAFFSIYGIATLFAGASISAMIMTSSLEIGKLVGTTFLYRYWNKCNKFLKTYLSFSVFVLMVITSLGIFGYLSAAYQKSSIEFNVSQEKITNTQNQKDYYNNQIDVSNKRIENLIKIRNSQEQRMDSSLTNEFLSRNPLQLKQLQQQTADLITDTDKNIKDENKKLQDTIEDIRKIDEEVNRLKLGAADKKDIQTFKFVADALNMPLDTVAKWFILSIIFVFDPLSICLILAYNVIVYKKDDSLPSIVTDQPIISENIPSPTQLTSDVVETPVAEQKPAQYSEWFKQMFKL